MRCGKIRFYIAVTKSHAIAIGKSLLGQGKRVDSSLLKLDEGHWMRAVEDSGYVAAQRSFISPIE